MSWHSQNDIESGPMWAVFLFLGWHFWSAYTETFNLAFDLLMIFSAMPSPVRDWSSSTPRYLTCVWQVRVLPAHCTWKKWSYFVGVSSLNRKVLTPFSLDGGITCCQSAILWLIQALRKVCSEFPHSYSLHVSLWLHKWHVVNNTQSRTTINKPARLYIYIYIYTKCHICARYYEGRVICVQK